MRPILLAPAAAVAAAVLLAAAAHSATPAQTVRVMQTDDRIQLSATPRAGTVRLVVRNASDDAHDFWLRGGGKTWKTRTLAGSRTATLTIALRKGARYAYWCSVGSHRRKGMSGSFVAR